MRKIIIYIIVLMVLCSFATAMIVPNVNAVKISLINQNPDPVEPGGYAELRFRIENIGGDYAKNVKFELIPEYPFSLDKGVSPILQIGDMYMQQVEEEAYVAYYKVRVDKDAIDGNNKIKARYTTDDGLTWSRSNFDIRVQTSDAIISIDGIKLNPEQIAPGSTAELKITLKNNADSLLKNIKINLGVVTVTATASAVTTTELPVTPIGSANEKMIENIAPSESKDIIFNIIADANAVSKVYKLPITLSYSDILGKNYSKEYYTSLIIGGEPDLFASIEESGIITSGNAGKITLKFTNKGSSDIKFLNVILLESDKYDIISSPEVYIGNIGSDDYESGEFSIYVKGTGSSSIQLPIQLEFKDANNKQFKKDSILQLPLYSSSKAKMYGLIAPSNPLGSILFLVIILVGLWYYLKKKKNIDILRLAKEKIKSLFSKKRK